MSIRLEGHGRTDLESTVFVDRTVGWFTNIYAVALDCSDDPEAAIINAKDTIRRVPDSGIGYGFTEHSVKPDICFNYLGESEDKGKTPVYSCGKMISDENKNETIVFNGGVLNGVMSFEIESYDDRFGKRFIEELSGYFEENVKKLAEYCSEFGEQANEQTLSDMQSSEIDELDIDFINSLLD